MAWACRFCFVPSIKKFDSKNRGIDCLWNNSPGGLVSDLKYENWRRIADPLLAHYTTYRICFLPLTSS